MLQNLLKLCLLITFIPAQSQVYHRLLLEKDNALNINYINVDLLNLKKKNNELIVINTYKDSIENSLNISVFLPIGIKTENEILTLFFNRRDSLTLYEKKRNIDFNKIIFKLNENEIQSLKKNKIEKLSISNFGTFNIEEKSYFMKFINNFPQ